MNICDGVGETSGGHSAAAPAIKKTNRPQSEYGLLLEVCKHTLQGLEQRVGMFTQPVGLEIRQ